MAAAQSMKIGILIGADASGVKPAAAEAEQALGKVRTAANDTSQSLNQLIAAQTGVGRAFADSQIRSDDIVAYGAQLDALRAKYNPLFAVISRYRAEVQNIRQAHSVGAISVNEMTAAITRERQATLASIDAIKGRGAALQSIGAANQNFNTANIAAQFQDIGVSIAGGMSPLQIALQQGTQLSSVFQQLRVSGVGLGGSLLAAFGSVVSPVSLLTIGIIAAGAAAIQYGADFLQAGRDSEETLKRQRDLIEDVARQWGDTMPALKAYFEEIQKAEDADKRRQATAAAIDQTWAGARTSIDAVNIAMADAISRLQAAGASSQDIVAVQDVFQRLQQRVASNKASLEDVRNAQTTLAVAFNQAGIPAVDGMTEAFKRLSEIVGVASGQTRRLASDTNNELADWERRRKAGEAYTEALLKVQKAYRDQYNPSNIPDGTRIPVPGEKPSLLDFDPNEAETKKLEAARKEAADKLEQQKKSYQDYLETQSQGIEKLQLEIQLAGASTAERQRAIAMLEAEQKIRELGLQTSSKEAELIRQKAAEQARLQQTINAGNVLKSQQDDIDRLRLEISLVGQSADMRARSIAAYEAEKQIRDQGINSLSQEAAAIRANAQERAKLQLELERQQAAYQSVQQAGSTMIDQLMVGTGSFKDRLKSMTETLLTTFQQLAFANPLKNQLLGTNLPTLGDLFSGKSASPVGTTSTAAMTVSAGTVMINGVPLGVSSFAPNSTLGQVLGANNNVPAAANSNVPLSSSVDAVNALRAPASTTTATGMDAQVWNYWASKGLQPHQIAGIMGNMKAESGFNPAAVGDGGDALGLAQWNDRGPAMKAYVGANWRTNPQGQLDFMNHEFQTTESASWARLKASTDVRSATAAVAGFERPQGYSVANPEGSHNWTGRLSGAEQAMQKFGQTTNNASTQVDALSTGALDTSKALTEGNSSLLSSITKVAEPAAPAATAPAAPAAPTGNLFSGLLGSIGQGISGIGSIISKLFSGIFGMFFANGGAFSGGSVIPFASGGVVNRPTLFPMSGGRTGVMGEAGPEAIMPLRRGADGRLGVSMAMPRQMRQTRADMNFRLHSTNTLHIQGVGDKELMERMYLANEEQLERQKAEMRNEFPRMIEDYRKNPYAVTYG